MRTLTLVTLGLALLPAVRAQDRLPDDLLAERKAEGGRKALVAGDFGVAKAQFEEVVAKHPNTPAARTARLGLAQVIVRTEDVDPPKVIALLSDAANDGNFADRAEAAHLTGLMHLELAATAADPKDDTERARQSFVTARDAARDRQKADLEARARCDLADAELRLGKLNEARSTAEPFAKDDRYAASPHRRRGLYLHGFSAFLLKDYPVAARSLGRAAPHDDRSTATHAEYLLGRIAELTNEPAEAESRYEAALANHRRAKREATKRLEADKSLSPLERKRLERLVNRVPDSVAAATYRRAVLNLESRQYDDALTQLESFAKDFPDSPLTPDAHLATGVALVQLRRPDDAIGKLLPLVEHKRLGDQAYLWVGKAQLRRARAGDKEAVKVALDCLQKSVELATRTGNDGDNRVRQSEAKWELADARQFAGELRQSAELYEQLWNDQAFPTRRAEVLARLAHAWGIAGEPDRSQARVDEFLRLYPDSRLLPQVMTRAGENALARAERAQAQNQNSDQVNRQYDEAAAKFQEVIDKFPDDDAAPAAHHLRAICLSRTGQFAEVVRAVERIPVERRATEFAGADLILGDALLRQLDPARPAGERRDLLDRAVAALKRAAESATPADLPAALVKLGHALQQSSAVAGSPEACDQAANQARETLERVTREFAQSPEARSARQELARLKAARGDRGGAVQELRPFAADDAYQNDPAAPVAVLQLAGLLLEENQPQEAARVAQESLRRHEGTLQRQPRTAILIQELRFAQALGLKQSGKPDDALRLFEQVMNGVQDRPLKAEAAVEIARTRADLARVKLKPRQEEYDRADAKGRDRLRDGLRQSYQELKNVAEWTDRVGDQIRDHAPTADARARLFYESAWAYRELAAAPEPVRLAKPDDAVKLYRKLIDQFVEGPTAELAHLELADLLAGRGETKEAAELLEGALDPSRPADAPVGETEARVRLKLGSLHRVAGEPAKAADQFDRVAKDPGSPVRFQALARAGEAYLAANQPAKAVAALTPFRDDPEFRDRDGVSARSLLLLGRAHQALKQYDLARKSFAAALERFPQDALSAEAQLGQGELLQAQGKHQEAIAAFERVADATLRPVAAQAQFRTGLSRIALKEYADAATGLLAIGYQYPDEQTVHRLARLEAARALALANNPKLAREVLTHLLKELPEDAPERPAAEEQLEALGK